MKKNTIEEVSAGGVVFRRVGKVYEFLIGKHSGYHKWVLPKGLVEAGENYIECAEREVFEEVGVVARIVDQEPLKIIEYDYSAEMEEVVNKNPHTEDTSRRVKKYQEDPDFVESKLGEGDDLVRVHKKVIFYLMELVSDGGEHGWEMESRQWLSFDEAHKTLAFESEQEVLLAVRQKLEI